MLILKFSGFTKAVDEKLNVLALFHPPGIRVVSLSDWRLRWNKLQTVYATAHH